MPEEVREAMLAIAGRDWDRLRPMLHPYLHWQTAGGTVVRGRVKVLEMLGSSAGAPVPPSSVELRDGQIYRWNV